MRRTLLAGTVIAAALAACTPPAHAESIAYLKGGDIFLSTADGARQYQVTAGGGYSSVSQSDGGTIVAAYGDGIRTVDRVTGAVVHDIKTPASSGTPGTTFAGPFDPVVSPDGRRVAYTWYYTQYGNQPGCQPPACMTHYGRQGTGFTRLDRLTGFEEHGFQAQTGWVSPSWLSNDSVVSSDPIQVGNKQTAQMVPGDELLKLAGGTFPWFSNDAERSMRDVERNAIKTGFAAVTGDASEKLQIYRPGVDHPEYPTDACFELTSPAGTFAGPSWKPDGSRLAWAEADGIRTIAIPDLSASCGTPTETEPTLLIPGGRMPDWGPADVPPARPVTTTEPVAEQTGPGKDGGRGADPTADGGRQGASRTGLRAASASKRRVRRKGLVVRVTGATPGRHTIKAKAGKRTVGSGKAKVGATGTGTVTIRVARRVLRKPGTVTLTLSGAGLRGKVTLR